MNTLVNFVYLDNVIDFLAIFLLLTSVEKRADTRCRYLIEIRYLIEFSKFYSNIE